MNVTGLPMRVSIRVSTLLRLCNVQETGGLNKPPFSRACENGLRRSPHAVESRKQRKEKRPSVSLNVGKKEGRYSAPLWPNRFCDLQPLR
jgi:hypothetical protein